FPVCVIFRLTLDVLNSEAQCHKLLAIIIWRLFRWIFRFQINPFGIRQGRQAAGLPAGSITEICGPSFAFGPRFGRALGRTLIGPSSDLLPFRDISIVAPTIEQWVTRQWAVLEKEPRGLPQLIFEVGGGLVLAFSIKLPAIGTNRALP